MNKKKYYIFFPILLILLIIFNGCIEENNTNNNYYLEVGEFGNFNKIQDAINNASDGYTIFINNGTYDETLIIDKEINLVGQDKNNTIISYNFNKNESDEISIIDVYSNNCSIEGIKIVGIGNSSNCIGIKISSSNNKIINNILEESEYGLFLKSNSENNIISNNMINNNEHGIGLISTSFNKILTNHIYHNTLYGIYLYSDSDNNIISYNNISNNVLLKEEIGPKGYGIRIKESEYNKIFSNIIKNNSRGLFFCCDASNNMIYNNNFENNYEYNSEDEAGDNQWDNGNQGNYWDDYTGVDLDGDGIGDLPYLITSESTYYDRYPYVNPLNL